MNRLPPPLLPPLPSRYNLHAPPGPRRAEHTDTPQGQRWRERWPLRKGQGQGARRRTRGRRAVIKLTAAYSTRQSLLLYAAAELAELASYIVRVQCRVAPGRVV